MIDNALVVQWREATSNLPWGVSAVLKETLELVADGKVRLAHSADYRKGVPCLINAVGSMLKVGGGHGVPMRQFGELVGTFDALNRAAVTHGAQRDDGFVSAAFGNALLLWGVWVTENGTNSIKPTQEEVTALVNNAYETQYVEISDEELAAFLADFNMLFTDDVETKLSTPIDNDVDLTDYHIGYAIVSG